jgi:hypothetical protein
MDKKNHQWTPMDTNSLAAEASCFAELKAESKKLKANS